MGQLMHNEGLCKPCDMSSANPYQRIGSIVCIDGTDHFAYMAYAKPMRHRYSASRLLEVGGRREW